MTLRQYLQHWLMIARYNLGGWYCYFHGHEDHRPGVCDRCSIPDIPTLADWVWDMRQQWREWFPGDPDDTDLPF